MRDYSAMLHRLPSAYEAEYAVQCPAQAAPFFSSRIQQNNQDVSKGSE